MFEIGTLPIKAEYDIRIDGGFAGWMGLISPLVNCSDAPRALERIGDGTMGCIVFEPRYIDLEVVPCR